MSEELFKWLVSTGVGGVIGAWALYELRGMRHDLSDTNERLNEWLTAIHSRLSTLGADSIPPPIPSDESPVWQRKTKRYRIRTSPVGWSSKSAVPDAVEDEDKKPGG